MHQFIKEAVKDNKSKFSIKKQSKVHKRKDKHKDETGRVLISMNTRPVSHTAVVMRNMLQMVAVVCKTCHSKTCSLFLSEKHEIENNGPG